MSDKLCPFCESDEIRSQGKDMSGIETVKCRCGLVYPARSWNNRPIEDKLCAKVERLREALEFYADPEKHELKGKWQDDYPGGIVYDIDKESWIDNGQMAQEVLKEIEDE